MKIRYFNNKKVWVGGKLIWLLVIEMFERKWGEGGESDGLYKNERCMGKCWV